MGEDIVRICLDQKACSRFVVRKLYRFLISEADTPGADLIDPLAERFANGYDFGKLVETMLRSNLFFSEQAYRTRIKAPVDYVLGMARALEARMGTNNGSVNLATALETLGQNVFHPPSVKGWDGGQTWLNGQTLLFRQNFALDMARRPAGYQKPGTAFQLAQIHGKSGPSSRVLPWTCSSGGRPGRNLPAGDRLRPDFQQTKATLVLDEAGRGRTPGREPVPPGDDAARIPTGLRGSPQRHKGHKGKKEIRSRRELGFFFVSFVPLW